MQPVRKSQARVRDVDAAGQHRHADRLDRLDLGRHERQHDVEIVNHQIEDHVDVEAALGKGPEAMHLDEARIDEQRPRGRDRPG